MSEPVELVEQELALVEQIEQLANDVYIFKAIRKMNNAAVRGWRLNIMRRVQSVQNDVTGVFNEDEYKYINSQIDSLNDALERLGSIEFDNSMKLIGQSKEIKQKYDEIINLMSDKTDVSELKTKKAKFDVRISDTRKILSEEKRKKRDVENLNKEIEEDNKAVEANLALYRGEARTYVEEINKELGWVSEDGKFAIFNEKEEKIEEFKTEDLAEDWSNWLANQEDTETALRDLPSDYQDELHDAFVDEPELAHDKARLYQYFYNVFEEEYQKFEKPQKPVEDFEELEKLPEIQPRKIRIDDIVVQQIRQSMILQGNKIPDDVIEEIQGYRVGKYELTIRKADRINELAQKYGLLRISIAKKNENRETTKELNSKIRELISVQNSFGGERNSRTGQSKIKNFVEATRNFLRRTRNQQAIFEASFHEFDNAAQDLKDWINRSWWQFGGQPENHHSAGAGDNSVVAKSSSSKSSYSGPTL